MSSDQVPGGSGPALSAHSKDSSVPGNTPASEATGRDASSSAQSSGAGAASASGVAGSARAAAEWASNTVSDAAGQARQGLSAGANRAATDLPAYIRDQPFIALTATGVACFMIGFLLGRR